MEKFADEFSKTVQYSLEESSVVSHIVGSAKFASVFNMDQTAVYIDMTPTRRSTSWVPNTSTSSKGMTENAFRASVFLCASATGDKLPPMIIFAGAVGATVEEEVQQSPLHRHQAILTVQKKAYCYESRMLYWIDEVWKPTGYSISTFRQPKNTQDGLC